jgi:hypothetical protein
MEPVLPDTCAVLTVAGADERTRLYAFPLADQRPGLPGDALAPDVNPFAVRILQRSGECLTVAMPRRPEHAWAFQTAPDYLPDEAWIVNRPRLDWHWGYRCNPGGDLVLLGRNLVAAHHYPRPDREHPVSFGGLLTGKTKVVARRKGTQRFIPLKATISSAYEAHIVLPADLLPGSYEVYAHSGIGGALGWSDPLEIDIKPAEVWPDTVFEADRYIKKCRGDIDAGIALALTAMIRNKGGILRFSARVYGIGKTIVMPPRSVLRGAGKDRTLLRLPAGEGPKPPFVAVTGDRDFAVEDLRIIGVHAPTLICAPRFVADTFDEAFLMKRVWHEGRASGIRISRCHLEQIPFMHEMRRKDKAHLARLAKSLYMGPQGLGVEMYQAVMIHGDDCLIEDNTIMGGGHAVCLDRSQGVRVSGNVLKAGPAGTALFFASKLTWPDDPAQGGAPIRGNYCNRALVDGNEITTYSERARNLLSFIFGGERLHVARNHIHGIQPTNDAEALLTHLWSARWSSASLRMTGPVTGDIVDPKGELANECLEDGAVDLVGGRGVGQIRRILSRQGNRIEIERPWKADPDDTSQVVFTAPLPFCMINLVDNRIVSQAVNIIVWGVSNDVMIDGNYTADGPGISVWSIRLAPDQKVWGGAGFTQIINNTVDRGWSFCEPGDSLKLARVNGIFMVASKWKSSAPDLGYDFLGLVIRDNLLLNHAGISLPMTYDCEAADGHRQRWRINESGLVVERNHLRDCHIGIAVEEGARAIVRRNTFKNVVYPLLRPGGRGSLPGDDLHGPDPDAGRSLRKIFVKSPFGRPVRVPIIGSD